MKKARIMLLALGVIAITAVAVGFKVNNFGIGSFYSYTLPIWAKVKQRAASDLYIQRPRLLLLPLDLLQL